MVASALGEMDRAFAWLETAVEDRDGMLGIFIGAPHFGALRPDPRYQEVLRRLNLA